MQDLPWEIHRHIHSFINDEISRIAYENTCSTVRNAVDTSFRKTLYNHVNAILPSCASSTMALMANTQAFIAGPAVVKSFSVLSPSLNPKDPKSTKSHKIATMPPLTQVDIYIPYNDAISDSDVLIKYYGHGRKLYPAYSSESGIRAVYMMYDVDVTIRFMFLSKDISMEHKVKSIPFRGMQFALHFPEIMPDHAEFITVCDMSDGKKATDDIVSMQLAVSNHAMRNMIIGEHLDTLELFIKYIREYSWTIDPGEMTNMKEQYKTLINDSAMHRIYFAEIWNSIITINNDLIPWKYGLLE